jgi:LPXTG-motif cell wall-anchored protein
VVANTGDIELGGTAFGLLLIGVALFFITGKSKKKESE